MYMVQHSHCVKNLFIRSFSGPCFPTFGLNMERYRIYLSLLLLIFHNHNKHTLSHILCVRPQLSVFNWTFYLISQKFFKLLQFVLFSVRSSCIQTSSTFRSYITEIVKRVLDIMFFILNNSTCHVLLGCSWITVIAHIFYIKPVLIPSLLCYCWTFISQVLTNIHELLVTLSNHNKLTLSELLRRALWYYLYEHIYTFLSRQFFLDW